MDKRVVVLMALREEDAEADMRLDMVGRSSQYLVEFLFGSLAIPKPVQRQAQSVPQLRALRIQLQPLAEQVCRSGPLARLHGEDTPVVVRVGAVQQPVVRLHQRIVDVWSSIAAQPNMRHGFLLFAQASIRERQRVVHAGGFRVLAECLFEIFDRPRLVSPCLGNTPQPLQDSGRAWLDVVCAEEEPLRIRTPTLIEVRLTQANEGRQILWAELDRPFEGLQRLLSIAGEQEELSQIVRPRRVARCQRLRVPETGLGGRMVSGGHQDEADIAVRAGELVGWRLW